MINVDLLFDYHLKQLNFLEKQRRSSCATFKLFHNRCIILALLSDLVLVYDSEFITIKTK